MIGLNSIIGLIGHGSTLLRGFRALTRVARFCDVVRDHVDAVDVIVGVVPTVTAAGDPLLWQRRRITSKTKKP
jgi:hypothetical protein